MRFLNLALFLLLLTLVRLAFADPGVILTTKGIDARTPMDQKSFPWSAIGRIDFTENGKPKRCTGTLVGKRIVLTAAHCVLDENKTTTVTFKPNYIDGKFEDVASSVLIKVGTTDPDKFDDKDWALVVLDKDLGTKYHYLGLISPSKLKLPKKVIFAGYSKDFRRGETAGVDQCKIIEFFPLLTYGHNCSMQEGASGGPLFFRKHKHYYIAGKNIQGDEGTFKEYSSDTGNDSVLTQELLDTLLDLREKYY